MLVNAALKVKMRSIIAALCGAILLQSNAFAEVIRTPNLTLDISPNWKYIPSGSQTGFKLFSASKEIEVNVLAQRPSQLTLNNLDLAAEKMLQGALSTHYQTAEKHGLKIIIDSSSISVAGEERKIEFYGRDNQGREFRHVTLISPGTSISFYADTLVGKQDKLDAAIKELILSIQK